MALAAAEAALPVTLVKIRPGRSIAVHTRPGTTASKPRLFFVHGSMASMLQFRQMIEHFAAHGHEIIAYDYLGCGRSPKPDGWHAYSFVEHELDLVAVLNIYGTQTTLWNANAEAHANVLVCHSAGCSLAIGMIARQPTRSSERGGPSAEVRALCLLGALAAAPSAHPVFYLPVRVLNWLQPTLSAGFEELALHAKTRDGTTPQRRVVLELARAVNSSNAMAVCKAYYRQLDFPTEEEVRMVGAAVPVVLLAGSHDQLVPHAATEALKVLLPPHVAMHVVGETSHQLMQEDPDAVCGHVEVFLRSMSMAG